MDLELALLPHQVNFNDIYSPELSQLHQLTLQELLHDQNPLRDLIFIAKSLQIIFQHLQFAIFSFLIELMAYFLNLGLLRLPTKCYLLKTNHHLMQPKRFKSIIKFFKVIVIKSNITLLTITGLIFNFNWQMLQSVAITVESMYLY